MKKKQINLAEFLIATGLLTGMCFLSLKNNFSESNLERIIGKEVEKNQTEKKDTLNYEIKQNYYLNGDETFQREYFIPYNF